MEKKDKKKRNKKYLLGTVCGARDREIVHAELFQ